MKFTELSQEAKEKACQWQAETSWWYEPEIEAAKENGKALGFDIDNVYFSGFWSQGDGASWEGATYIPTFLEHQKPTDPKWEIVKALIEEGVIASAVHVKKSGSHSHEMTMQLGDIEDFDSDFPLTSSKYPLLQGINCTDLYEAMGGNETMNELERWILDIARDYAREIYANLEAEYEYQTSEECVADLADANDWDFDETGELQ